MIDLRTVAGVGEWWRNAVIYQLYVRSFADGNGDGIGDLKGARARLPYLRELGVDAIWVNPWYVSPMADGGYDVADYRAIEPTFGTLGEAEGFIRDALKLGMRTIVDIVPNHVSDQHPWFEEALAAGPGSPLRDRFWFRPGTGPDGSLPPNGWTSHFGDIAWTRSKNPDGTEGEWYLHLFSPGQPDLNWEHPDVRREHTEVLRFWFDRGVAGVRIDSAVLAIKHPELPDVDPEQAADGHPFVDRDELHDVYRSWRALADAYRPPRVLIGEIWLPDRDRFARYLRADELHTAFNFDFMACPWEAGALCKSIVSTLDAHAPVGAPATWVLSNHDVTRVVTRYGRTNTSFSFGAKRMGIPTDLQRGQRRARAAALLAMALPGSFYVYQGEELGLPEVEDLPFDRIQDPMHFQSGGTDPGRDGCRVPLPWSGNTAPYGFSPPQATAEPWLPQPDDWATLTAAHQAGRAESMLELYRLALRVRRNHLTAADQPLEWLPTDDGVLAFRRGDVVCVVNLTTAATALPTAGTVLVSSAGTSGGLLPSDSAAWIQAHDKEHQP